MKKLLEFIANSITGKKAKVEEQRRGEEVIYTLRLPKEEVGKIIGKGGKVIKAIKKIMEVKQLTSAEPKRFFIKVEES